MLPGWFRGVWLDGRFVPTYGPRPASQIAHWLASDIDRVWSRALGSDYRKALRLAKKCMDAQGCGGVRLP